MLVSDQQILRNVRVQVYRKGIMQRPMGSTIERDDDVFEKEYQNIVYGQTHRYEMSRESSDERRFECFECTNTMKDGIGNVTAIDDKRGTCSVKAVLRGQEREFVNVRILDTQISKVHERVMVTEHIRIDGQIELVATKRRILKGDFNFFKFGWSDGQRRRTVKVDIYTGESKTLIEGPAPEGILING